MFAERKVPLQLAQSFMGESATCMQSQICTVISHKVYISYRIGHADQLEIDVHFQVFRGPSS